MKTYSVLLCLLLAIGANSFTAATAQVNIKDSLALVDLYRSTNGLSWFNHQHWLHGPVNTWYGITVRDERVTKIYLSSNSLDGSIPFSIGSLTALKELYLSNEVFSGGIPVSIGNLSNLSILYLNNSHLSGEIPASIGNVTTLTHINFRDNKLTGSIPSSIGNLINLNILSIDFNELSGTIPESLGNLKNLKILDADDNHFSGSLPSSLGNLFKTTELNFSYNNLSGEVPASFRNLKDVELFDNQLTQFDNIVAPFAKVRTTFINVGQNRFTFNGLEFLEQKITNAYYYEQARIPVHQHENVLSVSAGGTLSNNTYNWYKVGKKGITTIKADSTFHPTQSGQYYATVTNAIATGLILYSDTFTYTAPQQRITTSSQQSSNTAFSVYPNPATNALRVQFDGTAVFLLYDNRGNVLLTKTINNNEVINVSKYANGVYYIKNTTTGEVQKIVVVH